MLSVVAIIAESVVFLRHYISRSDSICRNELTRLNNDKEHGDAVAPEILLDTNAKTRTNAEAADIDTDTHKDCINQVQVVTPAAFSQRFGRQGVDGPHWNEDECGVAAEPLATFSEAQIESKWSSPSHLANSWPESTGGNVVNGDDDATGCSCNAAAPSTLGAGVGFVSTIWSELDKQRSTGMGRRELGGNDSKIMVKNIPYKVRVSELKRFFGSFGKVSDVYLLQEHMRNRSRSKGMAFVTYSSSEGVKHVMEAPMEALTLHGRVLMIEHAEPRSRNKPSQESKIYKTGSKDKNDEQFADAACSDEDDPDAMATSYDASADVSLIHSLHDEILVRVFLLLELRDRITIERVCKKWCAVARASWQSVKSLTFINIFKGLTFATVDSSSTSIGLTDQIFRSVLLRGCRNLLSLDLSSSPHLLTYKSLELIGKRCQKLESLNLTGVSLTNALLGQLTNKRCCKIKKIVLQRCLGVGEKGFWWLFHNCPQLEYVDIRESKRFRGKCFHILNESCHTVIVSGCTRMDDSAVYELTSKCATRLKCLDFSHCYHITDKAVGLIAQHCSQLIKLDLSGLTQAVTPAGLYSLEHLTELQELRLSQNAAVNDVVLIKVGGKCKKLRFVDISTCSEGIHDAGIRGLAGCSLLQVINISYLDLVTDEGFKHLVSHCSQLTKISARACVLLTDEAMLHLAHQCVLLQDLDVSGCEKLTCTTLNVFQEVSRNKDEDKTLHLTVGGTLIESTHASGIAGDSNGHIVVSFHNLAVVIKRFSTEAFFGSDDISDEEPDDVEVIADAVENWPDEYMGLPPEQFANVEAEMEPNMDPVPAGYYDRGRSGRRWDISDDFVNNYLEADDPSMWEEEDWFLS